MMRIMLLLYHGVENGKLMALIREWASTATMTSSSEYTYPGGVIPYYLNVLQGTGNEAR